MSDQYNDEYVGEFEAEYPEGVPAPVVTTSDKVLALLGGSFTLFGIVFFPELKGLVVTGGVAITGSVLRIVGRNGFMWNFTIVEDGRDVTSEFANDQGLGDGL